MEHRGLLTDQWKEKETEPGRRVYILTKEGKVYLMAGVESMKTRSAVLERLTTYYDTHYKTQ
jgi:DNA-binding PadR family transcriptional regulator